MLFSSANELSRIIILHVEIAWLSTSLIFPTGNFAGRTDDSKSRGFQGSTRSCICFGNSCMYVCDDESVTIHDSRRRSLTKGISFFHREK